MITVLDRADPRRGDAVALRGGLAMRGVGPVKRAAHVLGISERLMEDWRTGADKSPIVRTGKIVATLAAHEGLTPWPLLAYLRSEAMAAMAHVSDAALVRRFWRVMEEEAEAEGRENAAQQMYARSGDLEALERATLSEATLQEELAALCRELRRREIDPRDHGRR